MLIFEKRARKTKPLAAVCLCSRGLMSEERSSSFIIEAIRLDLRSWRGRMSSALVLTHLLFLVFKETLSHALPRTVAGNVSNSAAELQAGLATVAGEERSATPPGNRSGIIPPFFSPSDSLWDYFGLKDVPSSPHAGTCPTLSPRHCSVSGFTAAPAGRGATREAQHTKLW